MGASSYGQHLVWHSGMTPEEHQRRLAFKELLKQDEAEREAYQKAQEIHFDQQVQRAIEHT